VFLFEKTEVAHDGLKQKATAHQESPWVRRLVPDSGHCLYRPRRTNR
jgi:hypothetical protein